MLAPYLFDEMLKRVSGNFLSIEVKLKIDLDLVTIYTNFTCILQFPSIKFDFVP